MSIYNFLPNSPRSDSVHSFVTWRDGFSSEEIEKIIELCENLEKNQATVGTVDGGSVDENIRRTKVGWLKNTEEANWIYNKLAFITRRLNSQFYRFNLFGFVEDIQYTVYEETDEGHYSWHIDMGVETECSRKLSVVLQLSDPSEYEGGELQLLTSGEPTPVTKEKGLIAAFPSYTLHRVTPVTKGIRRTLVVWVAGPDFV